MPYKEFLLGFFEDMNAEEKEIWAPNQVYLALGNLLPTCAAHQIDACPMEGFDAEAYDRVLKLKEKGLASKIILPVGFRAEDDQFAGFEKVRRPLDEVVIEID
jgi:nitroreductase